MKDKYIRFTDMWTSIDSLAAKFFYPRVSEMGLTRGQPKMLRFLGENDGCRQKDIAERFYLRAASVSGILNTMERDGLIVRKTNPRSHRETLVFLTELGKEKLSQVKEFYGTLDEEVFGPPGENGFDDEEFEEMMAKLEKVRKLLETKVE